MPLGFHTHQTNAMRNYAPNIEIRFRRIRQILEMYGERQLKSTKQIWHERVKKILWENIMLRDRYNLETWQLEVEPRNGLVPIHALEPIGLRLPSPLIYWQTETKTTKICKLAVNGRWCVTLSFIYIALEIHKMRELYDKFLIQI